MDVAQDEDKDRDHASPIPVILWQLKVAVSEPPYHDDSSSP